MKSLFAGATIAFLLSGCADLILENNEEKAFSDKSPVIEPSNIETLADGAKIANKLSAAYFQSAISAQKTQDVASATLILAAASVVSGSIRGTSDSAIANRGLAAVGLQQAASRGVGKTSIESLYAGAQVLNCVGAVASIYQYDDSLGDKDSVAAAQIVAAVIREVRINVRNGLTRDVANYSEILTAFEATIKDDTGKKTLLRSSQLVPKSGVSVKALEAFLKRLSGCVTGKTVSASAKADGK